MISTNCRACIILENGLWGEIFELERGNAQGDTISPFLFNLGYQILLFKINFDLQIAGIITVPEPPEHLDPLPVSVSRNPRKVFCFTDNNNICTRMKVSSLRRNKHILEEYTEISGLECNVEKSFLIQIGSNDQVSEEIPALNFTIATKITILGLTIEGDSNRFTDSIKNIKDRIREKINFWTWFNLSLPGRVCIAKTMLYSQTCYLGCFLPIPGNDITEMQNLITDFVVDRLKVGKKGFFLSPSEGGLGLFELKTFLESQKCAWINPNPRGQGP